MGGRTEEARDCAEMLVFWHRTSIKLRPCILSKAYSANSMLKTTLFVSNVTWL